MDKHTMKLVACCDASIVDGMGGVGIVVYHDKMHEDNVLAEISVPMGTQRSSSDLEKCAVRKAWETAQSICQSKGSVVILTDFEQALTVPLKSTATLSVCVAHDPKCLGIKRAHLLAKRAAYVQATSPKAKQSYRALLGVMRCHGASSNS